MSALARSSNGCSALAWNPQSELQGSHSAQCTGRIPFAGGRLQRLRNQAATTHNVQGVRLPRADMQNQGTGGQQQKHPLAGRETVGETTGRMLDKGHPSRRDLLLLTGALSVAVAHTAKAEDDAPPASEAPAAAPPAESQIDTTPPELQNPTPVESPSPSPPAEPAKPTETPPPAESLPAATKQAPRPLEPNATITARAYLDVMVCPGGTSKSDRTLGDSNNICTPESGGEMLGRIVIGLYGKQVPRTVANFIAMVTGASGSTYKGTLFHKILEGQYIQAGKQGSRSEGHVLAPSALEKNPETVKPTAFALPHRRPGTVSLCLGVNDDEEDRKLSEDYRNVEFLITTGPGPVPSLDGSNIVFGTVLEGMDVVSRIAAVPSYQPNIRIKQFNELAEFLGDERAETARKFWDRPLQNVVIAGCGVIQPKPSPLPNGQP